MRHLTSAILLFLLLSRAGTPLLAQNGTTVSEKQLIDGKTAYIEGLKEFEHENYERALDLLTAAYVKLPGNGGVCYALADAYLQVEDLANAAYYGKQAVELEPGNKWYHLKLAEIYRNAGKNEATIGQLEIALDYHPGAKKILFELARTYADYGRWKESNETYRRILGLAGDDIKIRLQRLRNFSNMGRRDSMITELQAIQKLDPDELSTMQMLSQTYLEIGKAGKAKQTLRQALDKNERDPKTLIMLADIYVTESKWDSVATLLGTIISDPVVKPEAKLTVGQYLTSQLQHHPRNRQLQAAASELVEAFRTAEPNYAEAHALAAEFYAETRQHEEALSALARTTELMPSNERAWKQRMQMLLSRGQYKEVIGIGATANKHVPQDAFILFFWGSAYLADGHNRKAIEKLKEAATLPARKSLKSAIVSSLGDAYSGLEKWEEAYLTYEKALKIDPGNDLVLNNYAYYLSTQSKELDKALSMAKRAVSADPENASYLDTLGWVYYQKGNYAEAAKYIKASIDTGSASAEVLEHMGDVMNKLNHPAKARSWWKKALQKDSSRTHLKDKISR